MELLLQGERDRQSQSRETHEALKSSSDTIQLVNDTLTLAKEASARAAASIERRARAELASSDRKAQDLIIRSSSKDDRALVSVPKYRTELETLAEHVGQIEIYRIVLDEKIDLTPRCYFIKGMYEHLKQHFEVAIETWQRAANDETAEPSLRSLAWYWQGYENNNLGHFDDAKTAFEQAQRFATGPRIFELRRIALESEFFKSQQRRTHMILEKMLGLIDEAKASAVPDNVLDSIKGTAGNMLYVYGRELNAPGPDRNIEHAERLIGQARDTFASVSEPGKWSLLGYSQCCLLLKDGQDNAKEILRDKVRRMAQEEFVSRVEPRTKALARFTELICCLANVDKLGSELPAIQGQILQAVGEVDNRLTLYSLRQRRNVEKDQFQQDVAEMVKEAIGA